MEKHRSRAKSTVRINNDRVIVTEWRFEPAAETGWHRHEYDYVVVPQTSGTLLLETQEGQKTAELHSGSPYFRNRGIEHNVVNTNVYEFAFIEIELK